ncbi:sigma-70 family RNA polymerase sigma factor [Leptobacterium flavescens]|uniref:Sigma-70 family RNA polymerase sigma factor n=1 Tax=Leptobacterium flavescens TaxID=472055 RepID=A0A6P0UKP5_9FLAO|nr:sigma-70 family RNA polymerase sigma factor [Leptobacterium flavescens]NER13794.1 sigma-70 family RNA polymerase sigma factor [Leptobacterium flavescens]
MKNLPEKILWLSFKNGDKNAFKSMFCIYYPELFHYGSKLCGHKALTEDTLQDFFIYLHDNRQKLGELDSIRAYLFASFRRRLFKEMGKAVPSVEYNKLNTEMMEMQFSPEELAIQKEFHHIRKEKLSEILNTLSKREKEVIYLRYYCQIDIKDITEIMDINYQSVINTLQKAFKKLRSDIEMQKLQQLLKN